MSQPRLGSSSNFGTCEVKDWLKVLNTWIFGGRDGVIKGEAFLRREIHRKARACWYRRSCRKDRRAQGKRCGGRWVVFNWNRFAREALSGHEEHEPSQWE